MSSLIHFYSDTLWYPRHTNRAVDCSRREPKKDPRILYLGTVRINIPKIKYSALSFVHTFLQVIKKCMVLTQSAGENTDCRMMLSI